MLSRLDDAVAAREAALLAARRFAADAGHELRTPLQSVRANLDMASSEEANAGQRRLALQTAPLHPIGSAGLSTASELWRAVSRGRWRKTRMSTSAILPTVRFSPPGPGIPAAERARVIRRFARGRGATAAAAPRD